MRILIQHPVSKSFYSGEDWDENENHAVEFENVAGAEEFCQRQNLAGALIVVKFTNAAHDISYPAGSRDTLQFGRSFSRKLVR
jgi:hypothetical protein